MSEENALTHGQMLSQIFVRFDGIDQRLARGERRFDKFEAKLDAATEKHSEMQTELAKLQATVQQGSTPPWWFGARPVLIGLGLAMISGAGISTLLIAGFKLVPLLNQVSEAIK